VSEAVSGSVAVGSPPTPGEALASQELKSVDGHAHPAARPSWRKRLANGHLRAAGSEDHAICWRVSIRPVEKRVVIRDVWSGGQIWQGDAQWQPEATIWPSWHARQLTSEDISSLRLAEQACERDGQRLRESAKWMSTVVGATLAVLIGTSPLTDMKQGGASGIGMGVLGMIFLLATLYLVVRVMQPGLVRYEQLQAASHGPLFKWRTRLQDEQDLYLPCGIKCLDTLRQTMIVEELTLRVLGSAVERVTDEDRAVLEMTIEDRLARLRQLRATVGQVLAVAQFYVVQGRTRIATTWGIGFATAGVISIAVALLLH
jgi:hypothetical protein